MSPAKHHNQNFVRNTCKLWQKVIDPKLGFRRLDPIDISSSSFRKTSLLVTEEFMPCSRLLLRLLFPVVAVGWPHARKMPPDRSIIVRSPNRDASLSALLLVLQTNLGHNGPVSHMPAQIDQPVSFLHCQANQYASIGHSQTHPAFSATLCLYLSQSPRSDLPSSFSLPITPCLGYSAIPRVFCYS